ncbi:hypothetical protein PHYBOEH_002591 [Phytophthora boehmeriae]|uniref:Uncharacterized protein n=1 Tax=Phytophthora boehmeriae TaxID=109152 RepID=A0A8T1WSM6_9STRA|nr:hypothetical protein PHYBOEH_002591 [Phytophthora boehmeriae]
MECSQLQVNDLHKKFEDLNEEVSAALRVQQDAVASASAGSHNSVVSARQNGLKLGKRTADWRGDVAALAKQIDLQLQNSRALRSHYARSLLSTTAASQKLQEETEASRLRCLRSDLRLLQDFRVRYVRHKGEEEPTSIEEETKQLKTFLDKNAKKEKMGTKQDQSALILELFEMRRDIMSRISEDIVKEKKLLDAEVGNPEALTSIDILGDGGEEQRALQDLQKEKRERLLAKSRNSVVAMAAAPNSDKNAVKANESRAVSPTKNNNNNSSKEVVPTVGDDVHFSYQKLKREVAELKTINAKLMLTNSQFEDDLAHLQAKFDEEKRAHLNGKKWFVPKMQKLEDVVLTTSKAFEEVKLSVELMTNMYKHLSGTLTAQQEGEDELRRERDHVSLLLSDEIKKIAALTKENERKDRLVTLAMAARYEMVQLANRQEAIAKAAEEELHRQEVRSLQAEAKVTELKQQLENTSARLEATDSALLSAKESIVQLQEDVQASFRAAAAKEAELVVAFEKQQAAMQDKLDKTKRELLEAVSEMLSLDGRLRKAQEKLAQGGQ